MVIIWRVEGRTRSNASLPRGVSGGCRGSRGLGAPGDAGRAVAGILLVRVGGACAQRETAALVLPRLALAVPVETKLRQLLANLRGGLLLERDPNPLANNFRDAVNVGQAGEQGVQHLWGRECPVLLAGLGINREAVVRLLLWRSGLVCDWRNGALSFRCCCLRLGLMMGSVVEL